MCVAEGAVYQVMCIDNTHIMCVAEGAVYQVMCIDNQNEQYLS